MAKNGTNGSTAAATATKATSAEFAFERDTKRTYRFDGGDENPLTETLYFQKSAFDAQPKRIRVTVEVLEA